MYALFFQKFAIMADAPGKNDIDQIFKRLRSAAANKVN